jgi:FAD/FMN-containing dehydrogenase
MAEPTMSRRSFILSGAAAAAAVALPAWTIAAARRTSRYTRLMRELDAATRGPLVTRQSSGLSVAAQVWNQRFDGRSPYGVLYVANERDVQQAVRWAAHNHIPITARSGGHSYQGYSTIDSGLIVDLTNLASVAPRSGAVPYAHIGGGTSLGNAYQALAPYGLTIPGGTCPTVGVGGLAQGGGIGWVARRWGPLSDNVQAFRIVTADGRIRTANARTERDLFWACRGGGGGNFGIITSYDIRTHPTDPATHFVLRFPWAEAADVILAWQDWAYQTGPELFTLCSLVTNASGPNPTCQVSGQIFGDQTSLAAELAPFLAQVTPSSRSITAASYASLVQFWAQCTHQAQEQCLRRSQNPTGLIGRAFMWGKSEYVRESQPLTRAAANVICSFVGARQTQNQGSGEMILDSYGGLINQVSPTATAFVHRDMRCSMQYVAFWSGPDQQQTSVQWLRDFETGLKPYVSGQKYVNYIDSDQRTNPQAYYGQNLNRLIETRRKFDPHDVFRFRQAIPLTRPRA